MKENGFPTREYSLRRPFQDPTLDAVVLRQMSLERRMVGKNFPFLFFIVKYTLLVTLFTTLFWTLIRIPLTEEEVRETESPDATTKALGELTLISRLITIFLCCFGVCGVLMQSFSLTLVFVVFTMCRLMAVFLIPVLHNVVVSVSLLVSLSILSILFLVLVRRTEVPVDQGKSVLA